MSELFAAACSIAPTRRRRFLWAAWWTAAPARLPFRKPDASGGGARTRADALREAERAAGRQLVEIDGRWARAWSRVMVGQAPWPETAAAPDEPRHARTSRQVTEASIWQTLGVTPQATLADIKRAFRARALATHPDHGGDAASFRAVKAAYAEACKRRARKRQTRVK